MKASEDTVAARAVFIGEHGQAWRCDLENMCKVQQVDPEAFGTVAGWIVEAPWAHPLWHSYGVVLLHLRPLPKGAEPIIHLPGATHELIVFALDPDAKREELISEAFGNSFLHPANFAAQFIEMTDDGAIAQVEDSIRRICAGSLNPDTDALRQWVALWGDSMIKK